MLELGKKYADCSHTVLAVVLGVINRGRQERAELSEQKYTYGGGQWGTIVKLPLVMPTANKGLPIHVFGFCFQSSFLLVPPTLDDSRA